jgi:hypothetical protein
VFFCTCPAMPTPNQEVDGRQRELVVRDSENARTIATKDK